MNRSMPRLLQCGHRGIRRWSRYKDAGVEQNAPLHLTVFTPDILSSTFSISVGLGFPPVATWLMVYPVAFYDVFEAVGQLLLLLLQQSPQHGQLGFLG